MLLDLLLGITAYLIFGLMIIMIVLPDKLYSGMGFLVGVFMAVGVLFHMAYSLEDSVSMREHEALKHTRKTYALRMVVFSLVFVIFIFIDVIDIVSMLFGVFSLKVSAYIQPFTNKLKTKYTSKGR